MATAYIVNPARRPSRRKKATSKRRPTRRKRVATRRANPVRAVRRRVTRRRRSNPARKLSVKSLINQQLIPAAKQAGGALAADVAFGYVGGMLPDALTAGNMRHVTKGAFAIALSAITSSVFKAKWAHDIALGSLTVTLHDAGKELIASAAPSLPLGDIGYYSASPVYSADPFMNGYYPTNAIASSSADSLSGYYSTSGVSSAYDSSLA